MPATATAGRWIQIDTWMRAYERHRIRRMDSDDLRADTGRAVPEPRPELRFPHVYVG